jgi:hypothetical protein
MRSNKKQKHGLQTHTTNPIGMLATLILNTFGTELGKFFSSIIHVHISFMHIIENNVPQYTSIEEECFSEISEVLFDRTYVHPYQNGD